MVRSAGNAEYVGEIVLACSGGDPLSPFFTDFQIATNVPLASNVINSATQETEALLLIDEPQPAPALNMANGFPYTGQVKGEVGVPAGATGSGNVYHGTVASSNSVVWSGIPVVPPDPGGSRIFRFTNVRASALLAPGQPVLSFITTTPPLPINNPQQIVAFPMSGTTFTSQVIGDAAVFRFQETFPAR